MFLTSIASSLDVGVKVKASSSRNSERFFTNEIIMPPLLADCEITIEIRHYISVTTDQYLVLCIVTR